jgi:hypothetical protein
MEEAEKVEDPDSLSRIELVSSYMNEYAALGEAGRSKFEDAFRRRGLPLPDMSARASRAPATSARAAKASIDRETFLSYLLLIYTGTAVFYSWYYLVERLIRRDFRVGARHKIIQTGISLFYAAADILLLSLLAGAE